jgi:hypothetical protein
VTKPATPKRHISGTGEFCLESSDGLQWNCTFATRQACDEQAKAGVYKGCMPHPRASVGAKP